MGEEDRGLPQPRTAGVAATLVIGLLLGLGLVVPFGSAAHAAGARGARPCSAGLVALTFDDGPSVSQTPRLVRILKEHRLPATFFMVGSRVRRAPATARLVQRAGFGIGNHTWSHPLLTGLSDRAVHDQLVATAREMARSGIVPGRLMRPPYGAINARVRDDVRRLSLVPVLWSVDSRDWAGGGPAEIASRILAQLRPHRTNIVLQHDGVTNSPASIDAVPLVVSAARRRGYCFTDLNDVGLPRVPVPEVHAVVKSGSEDGPTEVRILLMLDRPTTREVSFRFRTVALTATPGVDYVPIALRLRFAPGTLRHWVRLQVLPDPAPESLESLQVVLDGATGLMIPQPVRTAGIADDDTIAIPARTPARTQAQAQTLTTAPPTPPPASAAMATDGLVLRVGPFDPWLQAS